jgi:RNA ligase
MLKPINWNNVEKLVSEGFINVNKHPELDLWIYNYSHSTMFSGEWNNETLQCRGLVVDKNKEITCRTPIKFFSYEQLLSYRSYIWASHVLRKIDKEPFQVQDKIDGSAFIISSYCGQIVTSTRGSFVSEQAVKGREILATRYKDFVPNPQYTYFCEIVYPENTIVIRYGVTNIFLLAVIETKTGKELDIYELDVPFPKAEVYNYSSFSELLKLQPENKEGFVVKFADNSRIKIKTEDYKIKHKILTNTNERTIWEYLKEDKPLKELYEVADDVFYNFIKEVSQGLLEKYSAIEKYAIAEFEKTWSALYWEDFNEERRAKFAILKQFRKDFAQLATKTQQTSLLFAMLDNRPYKELIWKQLEPKYPKKAFVLANIEDAE